MRFHCVGLSYTVTSPEWCECAYTQRVRHFIRAMTRLGHECIHYGSEGAEVDCEHVTIMSRKEQIELCGTDRQKEKILSKPDIYWNPNSMLWRTYNGKTIGALLPRAEKTDFVCFCHPYAKPVSQAITNDLVSNCEIGIGYHGSWASFRAFDSSFMKHATWVLQDGYNAAPREYDVVIPNLYDVADFPAGSGGDYLAHVAHLGVPKGLGIAVEVARYTGRKLIVGGPGLRMVDGQYIDPEGCSWSPFDFDYVGHVDQEQRATLMGGALAVLCPSRYLEPFGGTNVEAQLYGTPAITSDWGGFVDTVENGLTGFRCRIPDQWVQSVDMAHLLNRDLIRSIAIKKFSLETVGKQYEDWFVQIQARWISMNYWETISRKATPRLTEARQ